MVWKKFGVTTQEYFVIIDAAGVFVHKGPLSRDDLQAVSPLWLVNPVFGDAPYGLALAVGAAPSRSV